MTSNIKYIGMDVHKESVSIAVMNSVGKVVMESVIETKASMILQFIDGLLGDLQVTFEERTSAAWLYDLLKPHVTKLMVCDPRKNKSMREGNQNDKIDARRLAELLRLDHLTPVYHGEHGLRTLKELVRSYLTVTKDLARVMTRVKAIYRSPLYRTDQALLPSWPSFVQNCRFVDKTRGEKRGANVHSAVSVGGEANCSRHAYWPHQASVKCIAHRAESTSSRLRPRPRCRQLSL
jgi:Transposase